MRRKKLKKYSIYLTVFLALLALPSKGALQGRKADSGLRFGISFPAELGPSALDGRVLLMISTDGSQEPRTQINDGPKTQQIFGIDVDGLKPGQPAFVDGAVFGYPRKSLREVPAGTYWIQALLHKYETFKRSDGHAVKLPMDRGEGQHWNLAPGNLYSTPLDVTFEPGASTETRIALDKTIPAIAPPKDTRYIKHERIQSKLLSEFWGRPMYLGANILVPEGFETHPK